MEEWKAAHYKSDGSVCTPSYIERKCIMEKSEAMTPAVMAGAMTAVRERQALEAEMATAIRPYKERIAALDATVQEWLSAITS